MKLLVDMNSSPLQIGAVGLSPTVIGRQVIAALRKMEAELAKGALLSIDVSRTRVRMLPLLRTR